MSKALRQSCSHTLSLPQSNSALELLLCTLEQDQRGWSETF